MLLRLLARARLPPPAAASRVALFSRRPTAAAAAAAPVLPASASSSLRFYAGRRSGKADEGTQETQRQKGRVKGQASSPQWNEKLASESEADIKADKHPSKPMELLQEESLKAFLAEKGGRGAARTARLTPEKNEKLVRDNANSKGSGSIGP